MYADSTTSMLRQALLYARVSTEEQFATNQIEYAAGWAAKHGYAIAGIYADEGVSGTVPFDERPEGRRLLADLRANGTGTVLVYKLDRLGRDPAETMVAIKLIERAGGNLVSMTEAFDNSSAGRLMRTLLTAFAGFEREQTLERSSDAMSQLAGVPNYYPGGIVAYGYTVEGEGRDARLVIDDAPIPEIEMSAADVVRLIYRWIAADGRSTAWVAEELTRRGVPTRYTLDGRAVRRQRTSGIWRPARIGNLIRNSTYKGIAVYGQRKAGKSPFPVPVTTREVPAIVDADTWERAQAAMRSKVRAPKRGAKRKYLLRGLITCGSCGLNYSGWAYQTKHGERPYYTCNGKAMARGIYGEHGERCPNPPLGWKKEAEIWADIDAWLDDPGPLLARLAAQINAEASDGDDLGSEIDRLERRQSRQEEERSRLLTAYRKSIIDDGELESGLASIRQEASQIEAEINALARASERLQERRAQLATAAALLGELQAIRREGLTFEVKRRVIETVVKRIVVLPDGNVDVVYHFTHDRNHMDTDS